MFKEFWHSKAVGAMVGIAALAPAIVPGGARMAFAADPEAATPQRFNAVMQAMLPDRAAPQALAAVTDAPCVDGMADIYPCDKVDLLAFMPLAEVGGVAAGTAANDIWGWTDPQTGKEYAILGRVFGTSFVDISDPMNPVYLGELPATGEEPHVAPMHDEEGSFWRDIKVYADHAFIVSEASSHGMQVFDLTQLRNIATPPVVFAETTHYHGIGSAHNIAINEDTGFAYAVGVGGANSCAGGLSMHDISTPAAPSFAGCFSADGYTHDTQCVIYNGLDTNYQGREVCFNSNEDTLTIVDVTNKQAPVQISRNPYPQDGYTHQGWLTPDHRYFLQGDELDELNIGHNTRTRIWDVADLANPALVSVYDSPTSPAIDHNLYTRDDLVFQANYRAGLQILDISNPLAPVEVGSFDVYPANDSTGFNGAWSNYPYFDSGVVIVSGIEQGLFILKPMLDDESTLQASVSGTCPGSVTVSISGASPSSQVDMLRSRGTGSEALPGGPCAGTETGLARPRLLRTLTADEDGNASLRLRLRGMQCGTYVQPVERGSCEAGNVAQAP